MYEKLIQKMTNHFSEIGSIINCETCDYFGIHPISNDDVLMYYNLLNSEDITLPENISRRNHISCCLFYLSKENNEYKTRFISLFLRNFDFNQLKIIEEDLILIFNIIEFDKIYLNSEKNHLKFLYTLLKTFSNFSTNFGNYIIYKYLRGILKFATEEYNEANKEYYEIISEASEQQNLSNVIKFIRLRCQLLKLKLYLVSKKINQSDFREYWQFLKGLYDDVKKENKILALKLGFNLFSAYLEGKNYDNCISLLREMKSILTKELLKGTAIKDGIDYTLAIVSRLGFIGILIDDKKAINSAIKKIKKTLDIIKNDRNTKITQLIKTFKFILAILEISINKTSDFNMNDLASDFRKEFLPDLENRSPISYFVNDKNKNDIVINFQIINNMNEEIVRHGRIILDKCVKDIREQNYSSNNFLTFISAVHDKVNFYSNAYISDQNTEKKKYYRSKIIDYNNVALNIIYKLLEEEPLIKTKFVKSLIIEIHSSYAHIFIYEKELHQLKTIINVIDDLKKKLSIEDNLPAYALFHKIKGDFWFFFKDYNAAITYYERALKLFEKNNIKIAPVLFNLGCIHFFKGNTNEAKDYLNKSIREYSNLSLQKNIFRYNPNIEDIHLKIEKIKELLSYLS